MTRILRSKSFGGGPVTAVVISQEDRRAVWRHVSYLIVVMSLAALPSCNRAGNATRMNNDKSQSDSSNEPFVLGQQLADAHSAETKWRESGAGGESPLPDTDYDFWRGDLSLIAPTANPLDDEIRRVCRQYARSDAGGRYKIRHSISMDQFYTLINFAKRAAVFGIREAKAELVVDGLTAIAMIEQKRVDFRDVLWCLGLLYHAANKAGGNADQMFHDAAALAESEVAEFFVNFTEQTPDYRDIRTSWGYDEVQTDDGAGFIGWGFNDYNPTIDLKSTIIDISELVASDSYQPSQVEVATELPDVWLGGRQSAASQRILSSIRAGATVSASLRPDKHADHDSQQFTVFLVETANELDAQTLYQSAQANKSPNHCKFALARSRLFCLVVARSFVDGVDSYETNESLTRFSDGLDAILERHVATEKAK